jgi:hypothetical protein
VDDAENWRGGCYELAVRLGPRDDVRLDAAVRHLWAAARVTPASRRPVRGAAVEPGLRALEAAGSLRGQVVTPLSARCVCAFVAIREPGGAGADRLVFGLPLGALRRADPRVRRFPAAPPGDDGRSLAWRAPLERWLAELATGLAAVVPFDDALIGLDVSGREGTQQSR